jgi:hypothetical protein
LLHTETVAHVRWTSTLERLLIDDVRGEGRFLRVTVHDGVVVISHWQDEVCVAATRIPLSAAPELIALLAGALSAEDVDSA